MKQAMKRVTTTFLLKLANVKGATSLDDLRSRFKQDVVPIRNLSYQSHFFIIAFLLPFIALPFDFLMLSIGMLIAYMSTVRYTSFHQNLRATTLSKISFLCISVLLISGALAAISLWVIAANTNYALPPARIHYLSLFYIFWVVLYPTLFSTVINKQCHQAKYK